MATSDFTKLNPRKLKYIEARSRGLSKREAKNLAGYAATTSTYSVENSSVKGCADTPHAAGRASTLTLSASPKGYRPKRRSFSRKRVL